MVLSIKPWTAQSRYPIWDCIIFWPQKESVRPTTVSKKEMLQHAVLEILEAKDEMKIKNAIDIKSWEKGIKFIMFLFLQ